MMVIKFVPEQSLNRPLGMIAPRFLHTTAFLRASEFAKFLYCVTQYWWIPDSIALCEQIVDYVALASLVVYGLKTVGVFEGSNTEVSEEGAEQCTVFAVTS